MNRRAWLPAAVLLASILKLADAQATKAAPPAERWREVLAYGIESEVLQVIGQIGDAGDQSLNPELLQTLRSTANPAVAAAVLDLFAQREVRDAETLALETLSASENPGLLVPCMRYLAAIRSQEAEGPLLGLLDERDELASAAIQSLAALGRPASGEALLARLRDAGYSAALKSQLILALGTLKYSPAVEDLLAVVSNAEEERARRMYAASALGEIGDPKALPALRSLLASPDSLLRTYAAGALSGFALAEVEPALQDGLRDSNARVRQAAAKALARKDAQRSVEILIYKARHDPERQVRLQAFQSLGAIGGPRAVDFLNEVYRDRGQTALYRQEALAALLAGDPGAAGLAAVRAVVEEEWSSKDASVLDFTARRLSTLKQAGLGELFQRLLEHPNPIIRLHGLRGIRLNRLQSLRAEVRALAEGDPHPAVRREAQLALEEF
jgi:hypothetical protein